MPLLSQIQSFFTYKNKETEEDKRKECVLKQQIAFIHNLI